MLMILSCGVLKSIQPLKVTRVCFPVFNSVTVVDGVFHFIFTEM